MTRMDGSVPAASRLVFLYWWQLMLLSLYKWQLVYRYFLVRVYHWVAVSVC